MTGRVIDIKTKQMVKGAEPAPVKFPALFQSLTESEAGWGTRPDGFLVALDSDTFNRRAQEIKEAGSYAEFSYVNGAPIACYVTPEIHQRLLQENGSVWLHVRMSDRSWMVE